MTFAFSVRKFGREQEFEYGRMSSTIRAELKKRLTCWKMEKPLMFFLQERQR
ncbi:hypothetical protein [Leptotrichia sp. OH3620_COT-345]|uniref:hypothetical protein n=1 Tax=Leptotrichia sp. OH3620_COT-345 TaxID=2491048 RepID=UPI0013154B0C|nr:hypothetical protein [Leptotrichia sp. OH3620_COT-345]